MTEEDSTRGVYETPSPTMRELATVLFRQRRVFLLAAGTVLLLASFYIVFGNRYEAHMKVLVRRGRADAPVTAQENAPIDMTRLAISEEELNSEVELLKDEEVLHRVVKENELANKSWMQFLHPWEDGASRTERAVRRLAKELNVEPAKKTNLIVVSYRSREPATVAKVLQSLATAYLEKHKEVHRPDGEFQFFEQQTDASRRQLNEAEERLLRFSHSHGIVAAGQQRDLALQKLSEIEASYRQTQIELSETRERVAQLHEQLTSLPERTTTQMRRSDNPELMRALKSSLLELELRHTQLLTKFEPNHRLVQEIEFQIAQAKSAIAAEELNPVRDDTTDRNPGYEWAQTELQKEQVQQKGLEARAAATGAQLQTCRGFAARLGEDAIAQDDLLNTAKSAQEKYLLYLKKREQARMDDALDAGGIVNVTLAERPVTPALPLWSGWVILVAGAFAAGACGTAASFTFDYLDPAFRTPDEVLAYLDVPVLASLPKDACPAVSPWREAS